MNVERMRKLADHLEQLPPDQFDMDVWLMGHTKGYGCGTVGCIAGHACGLFLPEKQVKVLASYRVRIEAANLLDLSPEQVDYLFYGHFKALDSYATPNDADLGHITQAEAAAALREMADREEESSGRLKTAD